MGVRPKIVVIGPLPPFRGGIPDYNALLVKELQTQFTVIPISFSRLYPKWIYPGDLPPRLFENPLDALAPSTWNRTMKNLIHLHPQRVILHWWTAVLAPMTRTLLSQFKGAGIPVTVIIHNARPRDLPLSTSWSLRDAERFLVHNEIEAERMRKIFPRTPIDIQEMPTFDHFPLREPVPGEGIRLLCFGAMRKYKGIALLPQIMERLPPQKYQLVCAGKWWGGRSIQSALGRLPHVEILDRYLEPEEVSEVFARTDLLLLPYLNASASAVLTVARNRGVPVLASDLPQFQGQVWKQVPPSVEAFVRGIREFKKHRTPTPTQRNWPNLVQTLCASALKTTGLNIRHKISDGLSLFH